LVAKNKRARREEDKGRERGHGEDTSEAEGGFILIVTNAPSCDARSSQGFLL
jgi:hypothetical protein